MPIDPKKVQWDETPDVTVTKIGGKPIGQSADIDPAQVQWDPMPRGSVGTEAPRTRTWMQTGREAISNAPASAYQFGANMIEGIRNAPGALMDLTEALAATYVGRVDKMLPIIMAARKVGGAYAEMYKDEEALKAKIATDPVGFLADVSTFTGAGAMLAPGRTGQVLSTVSRVTDPGRVITGPATVIGGAGVNALRQAATGGKANVLLEATEGRTQDVINALRQQNEIVPGSVPTAGEAASPLGITRFAALQESAEKVLPTEYLARRKQQDAARAAAIREVGGTPVDLETARKIRDATAKTNYGAASKQLVDADEVFFGLLDRPSMEKVIARATELARERGQPFSIGRNVPEQTAPGAIEPGMGGMGVARGEVTVPAERAQYPVQSLHYMKMAFDDLIRDPETFGIGKAQAAGIAGTRGEFLNWVEGKADDYRGARETFRAQSGPINQMEIGQYLESKFLSALEGETKLRPSAFAGAVEAAPQTIKRATDGAVRYKKLSDVLSPDQVKIVEDIRKDLARQAEYRTQARAARPAGPSAETAATQTMIEAAGGATMPTLLNRFATIANAVMKRLAGKIDRKLAMEIASDLLQPETAALALEVAQRRAAKVSGAAEGVRTVGAGATRAVTPAASVTNALAEQERRNALAPQ